MGGFTLVALRDALALQEDLDHPIEAVGPAELLVALSLKNECLDFLAL